MYSCQSGSACPSGYTQDTSYTCTASQVCCKKDECPVGPQGGLTYSCQETCPVYSSFTKACTNNQSCCYQGNSSTPAPTPAGCGEAGGPALRYKCVSGACVSDNCDGTGTESESTCAGKCTATGTFRCDSIWAQQPQTCASGDCNINLGANFSGSRTSPIQQCWSKDNTSWGCNTDSQATSHAFPCGQTSIVSMTARENFNSSTNTAGASSTCPNVNITPTCGSTPPPPPIGTPLVCFRGDTNCAVSGQGYWHADGTGCACHCPPGENYTAANIFDQQHLGGVCYQEGTPTPPPPTPGSQGIVGSYWIKNADGTLTTTPQPYQANTLFPMFYWIYSPSGSYDAANGLYCGKLTTLNGGKICYQDAYYGTENSGLAYWAKADPYSVGGNSQELQLYSWPDGFKPTGYYTYQSVQTVETKTDYVCYDTRCFGTEYPYNCVDCGGQQCRAADCSTDTYAIKWGCIFNDGVGGYGQRTYGSLNSQTNPLTKNQINTITNFCAGEPNTNDGGYARVDLVFEKDPAPGACSMLLPTTGCNSTSPAVNLSWTGSLNAVSYDVFRSTDNGVSYSLLANATTNSYSNTNVSQNITYYYKVTAKNSYGSRDCTPPVSALAGSCDVTPPNVSLSFAHSGSNCYDDKTWPTDFAAAASVTPPATVSTVTFTLTPGVPASGTLVSGTGNEGIWKPSTPIPKPNPGNYTMKATAATQSNVSADSNVDNLNVRLSCANPWLKTTGGDIYSGTTINLPNAPRP